MHVTEFHYPQTTQEIRQLLQDHEINPTAQRLELASLLLSKPQHITAEQLLLKARDQGSCISKATVYNTLNLFSHKGLVKELLVDGDRVFFDSNTSEHHHFFNEETSELIDFSNEELEITQLPNAPRGMQCSGVEVLIKIKKAR